LSLFRWIAEKGCYKALVEEKTMLFEELVSGFIYSRRHGLRESGARKKASETTLQNYEDHLRIMVRFMQETRKRHRWSDVGREDVRGYVEFINDNSRWGHSTKMTLLRTFRTFLRYIDRDEECVNDELFGWKKFKRMIPAISQNARREFIPTPLDLKIWQKEFDTSTVYGYRNYVAFSTWIGTGIRLSELSTMLIDAMQLDNKQIFVKGKTGPRTVPVTDKLVRLLRGWMRRRAGLPGAYKSPYVFIGHGVDSVSRNGFGQVFRKMRKRNPKLPRLTAHLLRHSFGTYYLRRDANLERLRIIMGHSDIRTTQKYLHLAQVGSEQMKDEMERASPLAMLDEVRLDAKIARSGV
jgi:integrase/recombinase XerD